MEKPNNWAFDTTQFDSILKRLKVVNFMNFVFLFNPFQTYFKLSTHHSLLFMCFFLFLYWQQSAEPSDEGIFCLD